MEKTTKVVMEKIEKECLLALVKGDKLSSNLIQKFSDRHNDKKKIVVSNLISKLRRRVGEETIQIQGRGPKSFYRLQKGTNLEEIKKIIEEEMKDVDLTPNISSQQPKKKKKPMIVHQATPVLPKVTKSEKKVQVFHRNEALINAYCEGRTKAGCPITKGDLNPETFGFFGTMPDCTIQYRTVAFLEGIKHNLTSESGDETLIPFNILDNIDHREGGKCKDYYKYLYVIYTVAQEPHVNFKKKDIDLLIKGLSKEKVEEIQEKIYSEMVPETKFEELMKTKVESIIKNRHSFPQQKENLQQVKEVVKEVEVIVEKTVIKSALISEKETSKIVASLFVLFMSNEQRQEASIEELRRELYGQFLEVPEDKQILAVVEYLKQQGLLEYENGIIKLDIDKFDEAVKRYPFKETFTAFLTTRWSEKTVKQFVKRVQPLGELKNGMNLFALTLTESRRDLMSLYELKIRHGFVPGEELKYPEHLDKILNDQIPTIEKDPKQDLYDYCKG